MAQRLGQGEEAGGGDFREGTLAQFGLEAGEFLGERGGAGGGLTEEAILEFVQFEGATVVEVKAELAAPFAEGAFGDAEFRGDAGVGPTLGAAFDEFLLNLRCVHKDQ